MYRKPITNTLPALLLMILAVLAGCTSAAPQSSPEITPTLPVAELASPTPSAVPPTDTLEPTATTEPTVTPVPPTETPAPSPTPTLAVLEDGVSAWCLPQGVASPTDLSVQPVNAVSGALVNGALEVNNLPYSNCVFTFTFNQPVPTGLKLQVFELNVTTLWLEKELTPLESNPNAAAVMLNHDYIVAPPLWDVSYEIAIVDASGTEQHRTVANLHRWKPELCWNGQLPNMNTLRCPLPQDLHPWDAGYGTPIPTFPPEPED